MFMFMCWANKMKNMNSKLILCSRILVCGNDILLIGVNLTCVFLLFYIIQRVTALQEQLNSSE